MVFCSSLLTGQRRGRTRSARTLRAGRSPAGRCWPHDPPSPTDPSPSANACRPVASGATPTKRRCGSSGWWGARGARERWFLKCGSAAWQRRPCKLVSARASWASARTLCTNLFATSVPSGCAKHSAAFFTFCDRKRHTLLSKSGRTVSKRLQRRLVWSGLAAMRPPGARAEWPRAAGACIPAAAHRGSARRWPVRRLPRLSSPALRRP